VLEFIIPVKKMNCSMAGNVTITIATTEDIPELLHLVNSAYRGEESKKGWASEANIISGDTRTDEASVKEMMAKPGALFLLCRDETRQLIGCVYLQKQGSRLYLGMLAVNPDLQAKGIGKKILSAATEYAGQQHCLSIYMTVISARHELIVWYERHGYQKTGETEPFPTDNRFGIPQQPLEFIVLEKILPGKI